MSDKNIPAFQFYVADYLADERVQILSSAEEGIYIRLLCFCWREGSLPIDGSAIALLCKRDASALQIEKIIQTFFFEKEGRLHNKRLDKERAKQKAYKKNRSESGKLGAKKRWDSSHSTANGLAMAQPLAQPMAKNGSSSSSSSSSSDHIYISIGEYFNARKKEVAEFIAQDGEDAFNARVQSINDWVGAHGKTPEDYAALYRIFRKRDKEKNTTKFNGSYEVDMSNHPSRQIVNPIEPKIQK
mgnify:CR=1 FL=1